MGLIKLFVMGCAGYFASGLYDVALLHRKRVLSWLLYPGFFVTALPYPILFATWESPLQLGPRIAILSLVICFALLLAWSVLLEIPLAIRKSHRAYPTATRKQPLPIDCGAHPIYTEGTYRMSRHPGFLWFTMINILTSLYFLDIRILALCAAFTLCNLVLITVEDRFLFPKMFSGYDRYKERTPFLLSLHHQATTPKTPQASNPACPEATHEPHHRSTAP